MPTDSPRILLVDDEIAILDAMQLLLEDVGYTVTRATSLAEALHLIQSHVFHCIITDLMNKSPEDQFRGVRILREQAIPIPVGIATAWPIPPAAYNIDDFAFVLAKPFDIDDLITLVSAAIAVPLTPQQTQEASLVTRYFTALNAKDWDALCALCHEEVVYILPHTTTYSQTIQGKSAFRTYSEAIFHQFTGAHFTDILVTSLPDALAARYKGSWNSADGTRETLAGGTVFHITDGLIDHIGIYLPASQSLAAILETSEQATLPLSFSEGE
jgi:CheY-like chemotaxis protein